MRSPGLALLTLATLLTIPTPAAAGDEAAWMKFAPKGEPYVLEMPGKPDRRQEQDETIVGTVDRLTFSFQKDGRSYNANRIDLPGIATMFMSDSALFQQVREGLLGNDDAVETAYEDVERNGHEGKRLLYTKKDETGPREVRAEFYLVDDFMLNFLASVPAGARKDQVERFFASVELPEDD